MLHVAMKYNENTVKYNVMEYNIINRHGETVKIFLSAYVLCLLFTSHSQLFYTKVFSPPSQFEFVVFRIELWSTSPVHGGSTDGNTRHSQVSLLI